MKDLDVVVIGELNVDLILQDLSSFPEMGKEKIARNMVLTMGSASAILACNIARLGVKIGFIGNLGRDSFADIVLDTLKERQVDTGGIRQTGDIQTGITVALSFPDDYAMVTYMGAMKEFTFDEVDFNYLGRAKHMHLSSYYLQPGLRPRCAELFQRAKVAGLSTSFDPGWDPDEHWDADIMEVLKHVDVFLPNKQEALNITHQDSVEKALAELGLYSPVVVIKLGAEGAICMANGNRLRTHTYQVKPVDTTGAGDSFNSGFLYRWLQGTDSKESLRTGSACGALAVTKIGGTTASPTAAQLESFLAEHPEDLFTT